MSELILFGVPLSPYARKARLALLLADLPHEYRLTRPHADDSEFRAASPLGKIPALKHGDIAFSDSTVIVHYLARYCGADALFPQDKADFVRALWLEEYADTIMSPAIAGHLFAEVVLAKPFFNRAPIQADIELARGTELPKIYKFLESELSSDKAFLIGDSACIADIAVGGLLLALRHCGDEIPAQMPKLAAYCERFLQLSWVQIALQQELALLQQISYDSPLATGA